MRYRRLKLSSLFLLGLGWAGLQAQETIPASGGNASGDGGSASYTIGQIVYTTNTGTNGSAGQGVQQPYEISVITDIEEIAGFKLECKVYPNPTADYLRLIVTGEKLEGFYYQLYNFNGKLLKSRNVGSNVFTISMKDLAPAIYFLRISEYNKGFKTFRIIKN